MIPKGLRDRLAWAPGTPLDVIETSDGLTLRRSNSAKQSSFDDALERLRKISRWTGPRFSDEEEREAVDEMIRRSE